ncbi:hypothetical protein [Streptomyces kronopolitis]|uniref:hypothetical protein n=1 Tax=Streptomyces kronopolitis TaxID=1612435 RepID=UPI0036B6365C
MTYDNRHLREAFQRVPEIGDGHRWYDFPYRLIRNTLRSRVGRRIPRRVRQLLTYALNFLHPFNDHHRNLAWDPSDPWHNVTPPDEETLDIPGVWVIELFPPSEFDALVRSLDKNSWDTQRVRYGFGERNRDQLESLRSGRGGGWWRLGNVVSPGTFANPDAKVSKLPQDFTEVELTAAHIGDGLTAVVAFFNVSQGGACSLNNEWHRAHEAQLRWRNGRPVTEDRKWSSFRVTQGSRKLLHDRARNWMRDTLPGAFARRGVPQPLIELMLFSHYDPTLGTRMSLELSDALRALGLNCGPVEHCTSETFPGLLLDSAENRTCPTLDDNTWALWGQRTKVASLISHLHLYGGDSGSSIAHRINDGVRETLRLLSVSAFLGEVQAEFSRLRDAARAQHGKFNARRLRKMRDTFLEMSIDLSSIVRDVKHFHSRSRRVSEIPVFILEEPAWLADQLRDTGNAIPPMDYTNMLLESQEREVTDLAIEDREYREILSGVASLGASIDTFKVGRVALWVALLSLAVSMVALLLADVGSDTVLSRIVRFIAG